MQLRSFKKKKVRDRDRRPSSSYDEPPRKKKKKKFGHMPAVPSHLKKKKLKNKKVSSDTGSDWLTTDTDVIRGQMAAARAASGANRPPELYLRDGEKKRIRFRSVKPIGSFFRYSVRINGKWRQFTVPPKGSPDLFRKNVENIRPGHKLLYEVIDITGYTDRQGKKHRFVPRFLLASGRLGEQIEALRKKLGSKFTANTFEFSRSGQSTQTSYMLIPEGPSKPKLEELKAEQLASKARKFYAPPSLDEQKAVIGDVDDPDDDTQPF